MPPLHDILVVRLTSLGDVLMSIPAVKALKEALPDTRISWLVEGSVAELLRHQSFVDEVIQFPRDRIMRSLAEGRALQALRDLRTFFRHLRSRNYDVLVDFHGIMKSALLGFAARADKRIGFGRMFAKECSWLAYDERVNGTEKGLHKVERNMLLVRRLGVNGAVPHVELAAPPDAGAYVDDLLTEHNIRAPIIALFPFCSKGSAFKRWPLADYAGLLKLIRDAIPATVLILWGPGEEGEARELRDMAGTGTVLPASLGVAQLCALLKRAAMYVGGDTGVMHLAVFSGIPVLAIFGPTDPRVNAPFGSMHSLVRQELPCSPCRDKSCKERICLQSLAPHEVFAEVKRMWESVTRDANAQYSHSNPQTISNIQSSEPPKSADDRFCD